MGHTPDCNCPPCRYRRGEDLGQAPRLTVRLRPDIREFLLDHAEGARGLIERLVDQEREQSSRLRSLEKQLASLQEQLAAATIGKPAAPPEQLSDNRQKLTLDALSSRFRENFRKNVRARSLAYQLGLKGNEQTQTIGVGYCGTRGAAREDSERKEFSKLGLLEPNGRERLAGCLTVPYFTASGKLTGFWGCTLRGSGERRTEGQGLLTTGPLWEELVLVDGVFEALAAFGAGVIGVQAMDLLTPGWCASLYQAGVRKVWWAVRQPNLAMLNELVQAGLDCWRIDMPEDRDSRIDLLVHALSWIRALSSATRYEKKPLKKRGSV